MCSKVVNYLFSAYFGGQFLLPLPDFHNWSIVLINKLEEFGDKYFYAPKETLGGIYNVVIALSIHPSVRPSVPLRVRCISPIFFEVEIPNFLNCNVRLN